jgi:hypothetical protein
VPWWFKSKKSWCLGALVVRNTTWCPGGLKKEQILKMGSVRSVLKPIPISYKEDSRKLACVSHSWPTHVAGLKKFNPFIL